MLAIFELTRSRIIGTPTPRPIIKKPPYVQKIAPKNMRMKGSLADMKPNQNQNTLSGDLSKRISDKAKMYSAKPDNKSFGMRPSIYAGRQKQI